MAVRSRTATATPFLAQAGRGADHQGGLAHLAGGEHVAELAPREPLVEVAVGLALHVGGRVVPQGAAGDVEAGSMSQGS